MSAQNSIVSTKTAVTVYAILVLLTLFEVGLVMSGFPTSAAGVLMSGTTGTKIILIGLYFMHIKTDRPIAWLLPVIPTVLAVVFVLALFPDLVYHLPLRFR